MPLLGLSKQWFDPDLPLAHRLLVRLGHVIAAHPAEVRLVEATADPPSPWGGRALAAERTGRAGRRWRLIDPAMGRLALGQKAQHRAAWAVIDIRCGVI